MDLLENTKKVANVNLEDYDAIYLTGGHGAMFDFRQSKALETLMARFYETGRIVSTVADKPWEVHVKDGRLITSQNPSSASTHRER